MVGGTFLCFALDVVFRFFVRVEVTSVRLNDRKYAPLYACLLQAPPLLVSLGVFDVFFLGI